MTAHQHPIDFDALNKGDIITAEQIERIYQVRQGTNDYRFAMQRLRDEIERERADLVTCCDQNNVLICSDQKADEVLWQRHRLAVRSIGRNVRRRHRIDMSKLDTEGAARAEHRGRVAASSYAALLKEQRRVAREARLREAAAAKALKPGGETT